jgi:hypothetical protein
VYPELSIFIHIRGTIIYGHNYVLFGRPILGIIVYIRRVIGYAAIVMSHETAAWMASLLITCSWTTSKPKIAVDS